MQNKYVSNGGVAHAVSTANWGHKKLTILCSLLAVSALQNAAGQSGAGTRLNLLRCRFTIDIGFSNEADASDWRQDCQ